jgi:hypothetical protein
MNQKETARDYTQPAAALQTAIRDFLSMATLSPARRAQAGKELRQVLKEAEAALLTSPHGADGPGYAQLLVNVGVAKQELDRFGV